MKSEQEIKNKIEQVIKDLEELKTRADYHTSFKKMEAIGYKNALEWILR